MSANLDYLCREIDQWRDDDAVEDIAFQEPNVAWVYKHGRFERHECAMTATDLENLAIVAAAQRGGDISFGTNPWPLLMTDLDGRGRLAVVMKPCVEGCPSVTIRRGSDEWPTLRDLKAQGLFKNTQRDRPPPATTDARLLDLYLSDRYDEFLMEAVRLDKSIVLCGSNAAGKTHVSKALIGEIFDTERLIIVQNANELRGIKHPNRVQLYVDSNRRDDFVQPIDLIDIALRMRIGRFFLNEIRTPAEMLAYLVIGQTGHKGSITSIHAPHCEGVFDRMSYLVKQAPGGSGLNEADVRVQLRGMIDIIAHCNRSTSDGFGVDEIWYAPAKVSL